ncbi:MAG: hypothetical protein K1000chlam2_00746 [Chlamydiae bacterium]|nr:hypothetical protein [Chlamydiota bacterium]
MKKALLSLIFCCNLAFAACPYEDQLNYFWEDVVHKRQAAKSVFLPKDIKTLLEESAKEMKGGEHLLLGFFPQDCGFDQYTCGDFIDMREFSQTIEALQFEVFFCLPQRHLVRFKHPAEMQAFIKKMFNTNIPLEEVPLQFPTKFFIVELILNN